MLQQIAVFLLAWAGVIALCMIVIPTLRREKPKEESQEEVRDLQKSLIMRSRVFIRF